MSKDANTRFETVGELYYDRHRRLRPGKSEAMETGRSSMDPENVAQFENWIAMHGFTDAIDKIAELQEKVEAQNDIIEELQERI